MSRLRASANLRWAAGLFLLGLALRLGFVLAVTRPPQPGGGELPFNDMLFYHATAKALSEGLGFIGFSGEPTAGWPPAFPFLLSLLYRVFGPDPSVAEIFNAFLGAATVPLLFYVVLRTFGRSAALVAGVFLAIMPGQILITEGILSETLYAFVVVAFFALVVALPTEHRFTAVALGFAVGLVALTRGEGPLLAVVPIVIWWRELPWRAVAGRAAVMLAVAAVVVTPWVVRNAVQVEFIGISTNSGQTFWAGHNPEAFGGAWYPTGELRARLARLPREGSEVKQASLLREEALDWMVSHPLQEVTLVPRKLLYLNLGDSRAIQVGNTAEERARSSGVPATGGITPVIMHDARAAVLIGVVADVFWYGLLVLTALALLLMWRKLWSRSASRGAIVVLGMALVLYGFVFYGNFRYRMPLEPLMIMLAAPLLSGAWLARAELVTGDP